ncbi:2Fe-2S ferredoxin-type domain-containing protein [Umbelopsis sp. AD052]|nr:2Fe-2S ferredoxin-type domain-containing protein [Umbelopsis sp. AD052]
MLGNYAKVLRSAAVRQILSPARPNRTLSARRIPSTLPAMSFSTFGALRHGKEGVSRGDGPYTVHFITPEGEKIDVKATEGDTMLDLAQRYDIELECACEGSLACSTCHVICEQEYYDKMEEPTDEENDMLDLAFGLTDTLVEYM